MPNNETDLPIFKQPTIMLDTKQPQRYSMRLRLSIGALFLALILPAFGIFVYYIYETNYDIYKTNAIALINTHNAQISDKLIGLIDPIGDSLLTMVKQVQEDPRLFESSNYHDTMLLHLENNPDLVSVHLASDKGSFRQVQTMRPGMTFGDRIPPADAKFNFWVVVRSGISKSPTETDSSTNPTEGENSAAPTTPVAEPPVNSIFTFYKDAENLLATFVIENNFDSREQSFYKNLVKSYNEPENKDNKRFILVDEPFMSVSTLRPTMTISAPIVYDGAFRGMVGESFELTAISGFLTKIQIGKNSNTYILDTEGNIIVSTGANSGYRIEKNKLIRQNVSEAAGTPLEQAFQIRNGSTRNAKRDQFEFTDPDTSEVYLAQFTPFPNNFNKNWEVLTLVPVSDFLEGLYGTNKRLISYGGVACLLLVILIFVLSRTISRPIEALTEEIRDLLDFNRPSALIRSKIVEINILSSAVNKLRNTLRAFTSYVPRDLVNDLLRSGKNIELGGESRYLTIMFTDLKDFSTLSEITPSRALLKCVSEYLSLVTYAVKEEHGTVDKFIGDSVMAFWGAPLLDQDHAYHSCITALKSQRRMVKLNQQLIEEGLPTLTMRIGIHSDAVLVGNIGSTERMSYTVMGDGVNIASRLEGINKEYHTSICISHATFKEAGERLWTRPVDVITVKGRKGEITIHELVGIRGDDPETMATEREQALCLLTVEAFNLFLKKQYQEAAVAYQAIFDTYGDNLAYLMLSKCTQNLAEE